MALRGNLRDFSLPDVFQLVAFSGKTGVLRITRPDGVDGGVWFRDGEVFFAQSDWHGEALGERLVAAQRITPAALSKALAMQSAEPAGGRRLGAILVDEGYVTQGVLEAFVQEQIQDTIFDLMRWEEGDFDFEVLPDSVDEDIGLSVSLENIVMEGSRRLEEWGRIRKKIPSMDVVFKMATAPGDGSFEISLKPVEWSLLLLVDGSRSVAELAAETGRTDFDVARIVYGLVCAGLLEFVDADEIAVRRVEREKRERRAGSQLRAQRQAVSAPTVSQPEEASPVTTVAQAPQAAPSASPVEPAVVQPAPAPESDAEPIPYEPAADPQADLLQPFVVESLASDLLEAPEPVVEPVHEPAEEPTFLGDQSEASAHDLSVFEEMVAAVLESPEPDVEPVAPATHEPAELPPSMSVTPEATGGFDASDAASLLGLEPVAQSAPVAPERVAEPEPPTAPEALAPEPVSQPEPEAPPAPAPVDFVPEPTLEPPAVAQPQHVDETNAAPVEYEAAAQPEPTPSTSAPIAESPVASAPAEPPIVEPVAAEPQPAPDFERDLMALGLGEMPAPSAPAQEPSPEAPAADLPAPTLSDLIVTSEPAEAAPAAPEPADTTGVYDPDPSLLEFEALSSSLGPVAELEQLDRGEELAGEDIDSLIASLEEEPTEPEPELPLDEVDATLGSVLNDELSALTGAQRPTQRPSATVAKIPEPGKTLRRDTAIDRETLLRIIAGIEKL